jgi:hypothetical protein
MWGNFSAPSPAPGTTTLLGGQAPRVDDQQHNSTPPHPPAELHRQFAYDRLLAWLFLSEPDRWLLKGGGGLLARLPQARHSLDLDLFCRLELDAGVDALRPPASVTSATSSGSGSPQRPGRRCAVRRAPVGGSAGVDTSS